MASKLAIVFLSLSLRCIVIAAVSDRGLRGRTTRCDLRQWHLDAEDASNPGCSNSWKVPSWARNRPELYYESSEECCADHFAGQQCNIFDECAPEEQRNDHCDNPKWHFDLDTTRGCTNNPRFPESWNDPHAVADYLYATYEQCCEKFVKRGYPCPKHDVCIGLEGY